MNNKIPSPPKWADQFLVWFCDENLIEEIQGDLHEAFQYRARTLGVNKANRLFIEDVFRFFKPYAFEKYSNAKQFLPMFNNYFKIAFRNIIHRKGFTAINLLGLTVGISAVMLIGLYLNDELSYDKSTPEHERIYRLMNHYRDQTYTCMKFPKYFQSDEATQKTLINWLAENEEVEAACHFVPSQSAIGGGDQYFVEVNGEKHLTENFLFTNSGMGFQEVFPQTFLAGTPKSAFSDYDKVILTEKLAIGWFGNLWRQQNIIGKTLQIQGENYELAGVIDNVKGNVHYDFNLIIHQQRIPSWGAYTYLKTKPNQAAEPLLTRLNEDVDQVYPGYTEDVLEKGIISVPLADIHFTKDNLYELKPVANKAYLSTFAVVGFIILLIIWTNYTNLSIAMYADRQKELGMRKVLGARSQDISLQLLIEAIVLALLCFPFALLIVYDVLPYFNELMDINIDKSLLLSQWSLLLLLGILVLTGIFSGLYPAIVYGSRSMLHLFGKKFNSTFSKYRYLNFRNSLVSIQFIMVVGLLSLSYFIFQQMNYINSKDLGFEREGVVYFGIDGAEKYEQLKTSLLQLPEIEAIGANGVPGSEMFNQSTYKMKGTDVTLSDGTQEYVDYGSLKTIGVECKACELLDNGKESVFVINRTAAEKLAKIKGVTPEELIGQTLVTEPEWENEEFGYGVHHTVDGIINDYKYFSLKYETQTMLLEVVSKPEWVYNMMVKANTSNWKATIQNIEKAYAKIETQRPFDFTFLDDRLNQLYTEERRSSVLMGTLSVIAIILALMGLAGIVSFIAYNRQKEIGIRKVLGASVGRILLDFNKEFAILMAISTAIALPAALIIASKWLDNFAFHIDPSAWIVILAGVSALILVVIVVSLQARRVAFKQPVDTLRSDN